MTGAHIAWRALALLDLTDLGEAATEAGALALCARAIAPPVPVAAICIWPRFVAAARRALAGSPVAIATVVNFPDGGSAIAPVVAQTTQAVRDGADEIDLVLPWRAFLAGDDQIARAMVGAVKTACGTARLKVILETRRISRPRRRQGGLGAGHRGGGRFHQDLDRQDRAVGQPGAAGTMLARDRRTRRGPVGLKPSGGIRTLADAAGYLHLADEHHGTATGRRPKTFRFGASGLHQALARRDRRRDRRGGGQRRHGSDGILLR